MTKRSWNIWNVKNRWLRALVAWLAVICLAAVAAVVLPILCGGFVVIGAYRGIRNEFSDLFAGKGWAELFGHAWLAMTGRQA